KKRGACSRTISGMFVCAVAEAIPNWAVALAARAVARHVVSASGYFNETLAMPSGPVRMSGFQRAVERKSLRTTTSIGAAPASLTALFVIMIILASERLAPTRIACAAGAAG